MNDSALMSIQPPQINKIYNNQLKINLNFPIPEVDGSPSYISSTLSYCYWFFVLPSWHSNQIWICMLEYGNILQKFYAHSSYCFLPVKKNHLSHTISSILSTCNFIYQNIIHLQVIAICLSNLMIGNKDKHKICGKRSILSEFKQKGPESQGDSVFSYSIKYPSLNINKLEIQMLSMTANSKDEEASALQQLWQSLSAAGQRSRAQLCLHLAMAYSQKNKMKRKEASQT